MSGRFGRPKQGKEGERAMSNAEKKLAKGKQPKGKSELPGITVRRGRKEGA